MPLIWRLGCRAVLLWLGFACLFMPPQNALAQMPKLSDVKTWAIQLVGANYNEIAQSNYDMIVIDSGLVRKGSATLATPELLETLKRTPSGKRRIVLSYLSIGEAESYRYYWLDSWLSNRPDWLGPENPNWPDNYAIRFWMPEWQSILAGSPNAYLDRILAMGFDGVFLDGVDKFDVWQEQYPSAKQDMINLVAGVAAYGRERHKGFLVVPQNVDELLEDSRFSQLIDGVGREELLYGEKEAEQRNDQESIDYSLKLLQGFRRLGKPVFTIEYINRPELAASALLELKILDFIAYIGKHDLNLLTSPATDCAPPGCSQ